MGHPQTEGCLEIGEQLSSEGTRHALTIGIGQIDSVRILFEGEVSFPGNPGGSVASLQEWSDKLDRYGPRTLRRRSVQVAPI
jgi:hypothetical protein